MFQSLRPNCPLYVLHKGQNPTFEVGYITNVTPPRSKWGTIPNFTLPQELVVDLSVKINELVVNYNSIPASLEIADTICGTDSIVISDNKEAISSEVLNLKKKSQDIVDSLDLHKQLIIDYDNILGKINPEVAERLSQKEEINSLKDLMTEIAKSMLALMETNRSLIEQLKPRVL